jgi:hypothetical protein
VLVQEQQLITLSFFHGADDGVEFFGGTVNTSNLISIGNEDDQFDWTEGWSGTNTNWYGKLGFGKGNRGIEADNFELGYLNTPIANPSITNLTRDQVVPQLQVHG